MHWLGTVLAIYINKTLERHGKVFADRFKSKIVKTKKYFRKLFNYIKENIKKHMLISKDPELINYSSHHFYASGIADLIVTHFRDLIPFAKLNDK